MGSPQCGLVWFTCCPGPGAPDACLAGPGPCCSGRAEKAQWAPVGSCLEVGMGLGPERGRWVIGQKGVGLTSSRKSPEDSRQSGNLSRQPCWSQSHDPFPPQRGTCPGPRWLPGVENRSFSGALPAGLTFWVQLSKRSPRWGPPPPTPGLASDSTAGGSGRGLEQRLTCALRSPCPLAALACASVGKG